ncbi:unnamed protein product, partial [Meganyctiphanes norvegica]
MSLGQKYQKSPPASRAQSPTNSLSSSTSVPLSYRAGSPLPTPVSHRHNCMSGAAKRYKYLRRLLKFRQMDFEFAAWQMMHLFYSPQKIYRNFQYRKQTKQQFARDDPAFVVLLCFWLCGKMEYSAAGRILRLGPYPYFRPSSTTICGRMSELSQALGTRVWLWVVDARELPKIPRSSSTYAAYGYAECAHYRQGAKLFKILLVKIYIFFSISICATWLILYQNIFWI